MNQIRRRYSKAKANGNRVIWTARETLPVPFRMGGMVFDGAEWGVFRVTGRDMYCTGFRVDFQLPAGDANIQCNVGLYTGDNLLAPSGRLYLNGITMGGDRLVTPPLPMPVNSVWKFRLEIESPDGSEDYFPQGVTATYQLRYAQGPVDTNMFTKILSTGGIGFDAVGTTFVVE